jgi:thiol-disulfide isomerase/thioredoxin
MRFVTSATLCATFWAFHVAAIAAEDDGGPVRMYRISVGQEFCFEVRSGSWSDGPDGKPEVPREEDGSPKYERGELHLFVTARDDDGGFRVVTSGDSSAGFPYLSYGRLFADGRVAYEPALTPRLAEDSLRFLFPRLPAGEDDLQHGWEDVDERTDVHWKYAADGDDILASFKGPLDRIALATIDLRWRVSHTSGLPEFVELNGHWPRYKETGYRSAALKQVTQHDEAWASRFDADARKYFEFTKDQQRLLGADQLPLALAAQTADGAQSRLAEARAAIVAAKNEIKEAVFHDKLDSELKGFDEAREYRLKSAQRFASIAGQPSPSWTAADLDGREHRLEQYRGRVMLLDFWFRQCNYCIRAMPQIEEAADHFRTAGQAVAFLSVSTDLEEEDARFVAKELPITCPVLRSKELADKYQIKGFPTFLVLDSEGHVAGIFSGYSSRLREDLIACIEGLLVSQNSR